MKTTNPFWAVIGIVVLIPGCATSNNITATGGITGIASGVSAVVVPSSTRVWVLTPKVVFEDTLTEAPLDSPTHGGPSLVKALTDTAVSTLKAKNIQDVAYVGNGYLSAEKKAMAEEASASASRLVRSKPDSQAMQNLQTLSSTNENESVVALVQYVRVKVGPVGTWDPNTGAITSGASSSHFHAVLLDCKTGRVVWENSALLREVADAYNTKFNKVLTLLYSNINPAIKNKP